MSLPTGSVKPDYGVDAPRVIQTFLGVGAVLAAAGIAAVSLGHGTLLIGAGAMAVAASVLPLGLGLAMLAYAVVGKRRTRDWILDRHAWRGDEVVLDIGAGRGLMSVGAAKRLPQGRVLAVDIWRAADLSIEPVAERVRALREIVRVLKPGGRALLADYTGTGGYARVLREAGLSVQGPVNAMRPALSLMALVEAEKRVPE